MNARVKILNEVRRWNSVQNGGWDLCFQYCQYLYGNGDYDYGYRFIWRKPGKGNLQAARGQARIPNIDDIFYLIGKAKEEGWASIENSNEYLKNMLK